jgi:hypothetical protein
VQFLSYCPVTRLRIILASATLSPMAVVSRGLGFEMSSRASRTAAMIADAMTSVDA